MQDDVLSNERYEQLAVIGQGGMGKVLKCNDTVLKREIALKMLLSEADDKTVQRFQQEAQATAKLNHPNIIKVLDFGRLEEGPLYLTMEYLLGEGLDKLIEEKGFFEIEETIEIIEQICLGLEHAHSRGILHRDIKPSNIVLTEDLDGSLLVKLVDFGIAKFKTGKEEQALTNTGVVIGSPLYLSPGTATANDAEPTSEVYSLGCVIYELLTGKPPFQGENAMATMLMHLNDPIPSLAQKSDREFAPELEEIVAKCLSKERSERYQTVKDLRLALNEFRSDYLTQDEDIEEPLEDSYKDEVSKQIDYAGQAKDSGLALKVGLGMLGIILCIAIFSSFTKLFSEQAEDPPKTRKEIREQALKDMSGINNQIGTLGDALDAGSFIYYGKKTFKAEMTTDELLKKTCSPINLNVHTSIRKMEKIVFLRGAFLKDGLKYLPKTVKSIVFDQCQVSNEALRHLENRPALGSITFIKTPNLSLKSIVQFVNKTRIFYFCYSPLINKETGIAVLSESEYLELNKLKRVRELVIRDEKMLPSKLNQLDIGKLQVFGFRYCKSPQGDFLTEEHIESLKHFKNLRKLMAYRTTFNLEALKALSTLKIKTLRTSQSFTKDDIPILANIKTLQQLNFEVFYDENWANEFKKVRPDVMIIMNHKRM